MPVGLPPWLRFSRNLFTLRLAPSSLDLVLTLPRRGASAALGWRRSALSGSKIPPPPPPPPAISLRRGLRRPRLGIPVCPVRNRTNFTPFPLSSSRRAPCLRHLHRPHHYERTFLTCMRVCLAVPIPTLRRSSRPSLVSADLPSPSMPTFAPSSPRLCPWAAGRPVGSRAFRHRILAIAFLSQIAARTLCLPPPPPSPSLTLHESFLRLFSPRVVASLLSSRPALPLPRRLLNGPKTGTFSRRLFLLADGSLHAALLFHTTLRLFAPRSRTLYQAVPTAELAAAPFVSSNSPSYPRVSPRSTPPFSRSARLAPPSRSPSSPRPPSPSLARFLGPRPPRLALTSARSLCPRPPAPPAYPHPHRTPRTAPPAYLARLSSPLVPSAISPIVAYPSPPPTTIVATTLL